LTDLRVIRSAKSLAVWAALGILGALFAAQIATGASRQVHATATTITVTAGKPSEFAFTLSKKKAPVGTVVFKVTNKGKIAHTFKVCSTVAKATLANSCNGKVTKLLAPGASTTLIVKFIKSGAFEYLCTVPGHASAGMKGQLTIGAATTTSPPKTVTPPTTTTATTTTTSTPIVKPPATETLGGDPVDGAAVFKSAQCGGCHTLAAAGSTGTFGPNLDTLAPGQAAIVMQVTQGGGRMPSFASTLSTQQIADVAAYVYQSTHASS
jgi:uncharacterized cupredoxin-like copper-binding protein/mono/diheme cytochrome c family protein